MSKDVFLSNVANKLNFIDMLSYYLQLAGCLTEHGGGCRPVDRANSSVIGSYEEHCPRGRRYRSGHPVMLLHRDLGFDLFVQFLTRATTKKNLIWDIKVTQSEFGANICNNILFIYAIFDLGVTPHPDYMVSEKGLSLKRFTSSALFRDNAEQFCKKDATVDDVLDAAEAELVYGKEGDNLDGLRYAKFCDKVATNKVLRLCPRPSAAARYHNMRVYLQVQQWLVFCNMRETDWGWMTKDENVVLL